MELTTRIVKNTTIFFIAQVMSYLLVFLYTIYIVRYLGPNNFGILTFGISVISILGIFTDLGLNTLMTREIARDKSKNLEYFSNFITIKLVLISLIMVPTLVIIYMLNYSGNVFYVIIVLMFSMVFTTFSGAFYSIFQAYEKLEFQSAMIFFSSILMLIGVLAVIHYELNVVAFAFVYLLVGGITLIYCIFIAYRNFILPNLKFDLDFWKNNIKFALRFGLVGIFATIYVWIDSSMLFFIHGSIATGFYGASYRIVLALLFIPSAISAAVFPVLSRLHSTSYDSVKEIIWRYFKYMLIVGVPMGLGGTLLAPQIIIFLYGDSYVNSILVFQILICATAFTFANAAFVQLFQSTNKELIVTKITGLWVIGNILLNLILIPKYSYIGASISTLITEFGVATFLIIAYSKTRYVIEKRMVFLTLSKIIVASMIMGIVIWILKFVNLILLIIIAIIFYLSISYLIGAINQEDIKIIKSIRK